MIEMPARLASRAQAPDKAGRPTGILAAVAARTSVPRRVGVAFLAATAGAGHALYPAWLALATVGSRKPVPPSPESWPEISVVVPAYLERDVIGGKVDDLRGNGYPGRLEIVVVADDEGTAAAAEEVGADVVVAGERRGKADAINRGVEAARHDVLVLTDANTILAPGSLAALVRWLTDPTIGGVAGEKRLYGRTGEGIYWAFESWLKQREAMTGTTIGLVGELAAVRRSSFRKIPTDVAVDDLWLALDLSELGVRIAYEPDAVALEEPTPSWRQEWERRTRIQAGMLDVVWRWRSMLVPRRSVVWTQVWGHRLARGSFGPLAHAVLLLLAIRSARRSLTASLFLVLHAAGVGALLRDLTGARQTMLARAASQALFLQAVGLGGTLRWLRGDRPSVWRKIDRGG